MGRAWGLGKDRVAWGSIAWPGLGPYCIDTYLFTQFADDQGPDG